MITLSGQAIVTLTAGTSGAYQGVTVFQDPASNVPISVTGQAALNVTGVIYAPAAAVSIVGKGVVTINPGPGTATLPPINGALIVYDLKADGNGVLTINPDPAAHSAPAASPATLAATTATADVNAAAIAALASEDNLIPPSASMNTATIEQLVMSLVANPDSSGSATTTLLKKKR
jgi:hypothetical protein